VRAIDGVSFGACVAQIARECTRVVEGPFRDTEGRPNP